MGATWDPRVCKQQSLVDLKAWWGEWLTASVFLGQSPKNICRAGWQDPRVSTLPAL